MNLTELTIRLNGESQRIPAGLTIAELIAQLALQDRRIAVELNGKILPRGQHAQRQLLADDQIEIVTAIGGG